MRANDRVKYMINVQEMYFFHSYANLYRPNIAYRSHEARANDGNKIPLYRAIRAHFGPLS